MNRKDWMQCRLFWSSWCLWQSFFREVMHMHSQVWAQLLEIKLGRTIWFDLRNQWAIQRMNQVASRFANQPMIKWLMIKQQFQDWNGMLSFLISFRQNKESIAYRKSRMQSFQAKLLSWLLKLLPTPLISLRQSIMCTHPTIPQEWPTSEWHSARVLLRVVLDHFIPHRGYHDHPIGKDQNSKVSMYLPVFSVSVQDWIVGFILIPDVSPLL